MRKFTLTPFFMNKQGLDGLYAVGLYTSVKVVSKGEYSVRSHVRQGIECF